MPQDMKPNGLSPAGVSVPAVFELTSFLEGRTVAWGIFEDRFGRMRRRFEVEMFGRWDGDLFSLEESFVYDDGSRDQRVWRVLPENEGRFSATCNDCIGIARGRCDGDSIRMRYRFRLKFDERALDVDFDDRIYRMGDGLAINRAIMRKWGVKLGELSLFFRRESLGSQTGSIKRAAA